MTAPYEFATKQVQTIFAQSATAPLINTETAEHIGQILLDFLPTAAFRTLRRDTPLSTGGFPILVATESTYDADTVIGPDYELSDPPASIASKVLSNDLGCVSEICRMNIETFDEIVRRMKTGAEGNATFYRTTATGSQERVHIAFAPVAVQSFRSVDNTDFSRGLDASQYMIYSLALVEPETGIMERFDPIEEETQQQIRTAIGVLSTLLAVATIIVVYVSLHVTKSIAEPMVYLLEIIRSIR